ncbi:MAG TPA: sodium-dependent transporter [Gammaproteobacteria bacterium]|nr:sodium-dependent transporter [Gammaproteobacteria bacterium]
MATKTKSIHGEWSGRLAFIFAATGSAVGLGNIWKFPYITGENGGGAFVLVYLICIATIGIPIMMAEILMGRRGRQSPLNTMVKLAHEAGASPHWKYLGILGVFAGFLILSYYSVIAGWALAYIERAASGAFTGASGEQIGQMFGALTGDWEKLLGWHTLFMVMTILVVARGVRDGLEKAVSLLMPLLFIILVLLVGYAAAQGDFARAVHFMFNPDFSKLTGHSILVAMGHSFFTLSLGMGAIMIYGSYLPSHVSIGQVTLVVAIADTVVALLAGLAIFPIVFSNGLEPAAGPGLIFQTLPLAFGQMPGGVVIGTLFFIMLVFAAWTSAISLIEPAVTWLVENTRLDRMAAAAISGGVAWVLGIGTVLSFNAWSEIKWFGRTFFDNLDFVTTNIMLPLGGLLISIFAAWIMHRRHLLDELELPDGALFQLWHFLIRFFAPAAVIIIFLNSVGII